MALETASLRSPDLMPAEGPRLVADSCLLVFPSDGWGRGSKLSPVFVEHYPHCGDNFHVITFEGPRLQTP